MSKGTSYFFPHRI